MVSLLVLIYPHTSIRAHTGDAGMIAFAQAFCHAPCAQTLEEFVPNGGHIGADGVKAFADTIMGGHLPSLGSLMLVANPDIGDAGLLPLIAVLNSEQCPVDLYFLGLHEVGMTPTSVRALAAVIREGGAPSLCSVLLSDNLADADKLLLQQAVDISERGIRLGWRDDYL